MTQRSEYDDIRAHIEAEAGHAADLFSIASELLDDLEQARMREARMRAHYLALLTAARASVAAEAEGNADPLDFVINELAKNGQLPTGEEVTRILSDARAAQALVAALSEPTPRRHRASAPSANLRRCVGVSRTQHR